MLPRPLRRWAQVVPPVQALQAPQALAVRGGVVEYYDDLETRDPEAREAALLAALPVQVAHAKAKAPAYAEILAGVDPAAVTDRGALAQLPVIRKADLRSEEHTSELQSLMRISYA